ncbi:MAG: LysM peptidoglycan-binding domain-containing protein [Chthoniobacterales bacterium]
MNLRQAFFVILLASAIVGGTVYFARRVFAPPARPNVPWVAYVDPSVKKLKEAQELNDHGKLSEARDILVDTLVTAPGAPVTRELRDLLGEINTRLFFRQQTSLRKTEYTVVRGDALSSIARKLKSSADAIIKVNGLESTVIRPGEKLLVPKLDFTISIDLPRQRVVVHDSHGFFTQYPIAAVDLPKTKSVKVETTVTAKSFWDGGEPVGGKSKNDSEERTPLIALGRRGYVLYGIAENSEESESEIEVDGEDKPSSEVAPDPNYPPQGIAMLKDDIAELKFLIHRGTPVTIILDRK